MIADFRQLTTDLAALVGQLKQRCLEAEAHAAELEQQLAEQSAQLAQLKAEKTDIETKYRNLKTGVAAAGNNAEQVALLKEQYLAMVSEIDACIAMLQHG